MVDAGGVIMTSDGSPQCGVLPEAHTPLFGIIMMISNINFDDKGESFRAVRGMDEVIHYMILPKFVLYI